MADRLDSERLRDFCDRLTDGQTDRQFAILKLLSQLKIILILDAAEEKRCIEKVVLEEQTEWDQEIQCHHR